jgi:DNA-binding MarR family transcriptional regulator
MLMRTIDNKGDAMPHVVLRVLQALEESQDHRVRTIAELAGVKQTHAYNIIRKLDAKGIVTIVSDPNCRLEVEVNIPSRNFRTK